MGDVIYLYRYFVPCCTSDIPCTEQCRGEVSVIQHEIIAVSPDSVAAHIAWLLSLRNMNKGSDINLNLISDRDLNISSKYAVNNVGDDAGKLEKAVVIIDQTGVVQAVHTFPHATGINITELERQLLALQTARYQFAMTPSGWTPATRYLNIRLRRLPPQAKCHRTHSIGQQMRGLVSLLPPGLGTAQALPHLSGGGSEDERTIKFLKIKKKHGPGKKEKLHPYVASPFPV